MLNPFGVDGGHWWVALVGGVGVALTLQFNAAATPLKTVGTIGAGKLTRKTMKEPLANGGRADWGDKVETAAVTATMNRHLDVACRVVPGTGAAQSGVDRPDCNVEVLSGAGNRCAAFHVVGQRRPTCGRVATPTMSPTEASACATGATAMCCPRSSTPFVAARGEAHSLVSAMRNGSAFMGRSQSQRMRAGSYQRTRPGGAVCQSVTVPVAAAAVRQRSANAIQSSAARWRAGDSAAVQSSGTQSR